MFTVTCEAIEMCLGALGKIKSNSCVSIITLINTFVEEFYFLNMNPDTYKYFFSM